MSHLFDYSKVVTEGIMPIDENGKYTAVFCKRMSIPNNEYDMLVVWPYGTATWHNWLTGKSKPDVHKQFGLLLPSKEKDVDKYNNVAGHNISKITLDEFANKAPVNEIKPPISVRPFSLEALKAGEQVINAFGEKPLLCVEIPFNEERALRVMAVWSSGQVTWHNRDGCAPSQRYNLFLAPKKIILYHNLLKSLNGTIWSLSYNSKAQAEGDANLGYGRAIEVLKTAIPFEYEL